MGGISGEVDGVKEVDMLAVCTNSYSGCAKSLISLELSVRLTPNFDTVYLRVCPTRWHCFYANDATGCAQVHQIWHQSSKDAYSVSCPQHTENKERYNLECSYALLDLSLPCGFGVYVALVHIQRVFLLCKQFLRS